MRPLRCLVLFTSVLLILGWATPFFAVVFPAQASPEGQLVENVTTPFGKFHGIDYVRHVGRFEGTTSLGPYRVPYEIIAPANPERGNGHVLVEPSHFALRLAARDVFLGHEFLFERGFSHAGVGWSTFLQSILDPGATDVFIAGDFDDEIIVDFAHALREAPEAQPLLGSVQGLYGTGYSQTSATLHRIVHSPSGEGLLDLTLLHGLPWPHIGSELISEPHVPAEGRVIVLNTENDIALTDSESLRADDGLFPDYRLYEIAGAPHVPENEAVPIVTESVMPPLDWTPVARAVFVAGDEWVQDGVEPPSSVFLESTSEPDPVYPFPTQIARDENLNARGGVRLSALEIGRGQFIASRFGEPFPLFLFGRFVDLQCVPLPDGSPRFATHGDYVSAFTDATNEVVKERFLLQEDAILLITQAAKSEVGKPGSCP